MKKTFGIMIGLLLFVFLVSGCGSDGSKEAGSIIKAQADVTEEYVNSISDAKSADDVVKALENYTEGLKKLVPDLKAFHEKYPEYAQGKVPEGVEVDMKRLEELSGKMSGAMMKMGSYMMDPKVQEAMQKMGEEMSKIQ